MCGTNCNVNKLQVDSGEAAGRLARSRREFIPPTVDGKKPGEYVIFNKSRTQGTTDAETRDTDGKRWILQCLEGYI